MKSIMKLLATIICLAAMCGFRANAQESPYLKAHIPFDFTAGNKTLHPGDYIIKRGLSSHPDVLLIVGRRGRDEMFLLVNRSISRVEPKESHLVFDRLGDRYFLSSIWMSGDENGSKVPLPKEERALEMSGIDPERVVIGTVAGGAQPSE